MKDSMKAMSRKYMLVGVLAAVIVPACALETGDPTSEEAQSELGGDPAADVIANAATGGCTGAFPISSCISRSGNSVLGDFYMNVPPDSSFFSYTVDITRSNLGTRRVASGRIDHQGHYGAWGANIITAPPSSGCATTVVKVFNSAGAFHLSNTSPAVCY